MKNKKAQGWIEGRKRSAPCFSPGVLLALLLTSPSSAQGESVPATALARVPAMSHVRLSPDGRYVLFTSQLNDRRVVFSLDRANAKRTVVALSVPADRGDRFQECLWVNESRFICVLARETQWHGRARVRVTLVASNADGTGQRNLFQGRDRLEWFDRVIDVTPDDPRSILVQVDGDVFELDVYTRALQKVASAVKPMNAFHADTRGAVRLAFGDYGDQSHVWYRATQESDWQKLDSWRKRERNATFIPRMLIDDSDRAYAIGPSARGRRALWQVNLSTKDQPTLVYEDGEHDVADVVVSWRRKLLGVRLDSAVPAYRYLDKRAASVASGAQSTLSGAKVEIIDTSADEAIYLLRSYSDEDAGTFHLLDAGSGKGELEEIGSAYPELKIQRLPRAKPMPVRALDGISVPARLTLPLQTAPAKPRLVVLAQAARANPSNWDLGFIRHFLSSRGYAVLEVDHRGPSFSWSMDYFDRSEWERGLALTDILDAVRTAIEKSLVNREGIAIAGWGEDGRVALRAMQKEPALFGCAISVAGITDLRHIASVARYAPYRDRFEELIDADSKWLERESPVTRARVSSGAIRLVHGTNDAILPGGHSQAMSRELKRLNRKHEFVELEDASHGIDDASDRAALLLSIETVLSSGCTTH